MAANIPVYLFTGFLEAGKTRFIQETLEDRRFNHVVPVEGGIMEKECAAILSEYFKRKRK